VIYEGTILRVRWHPRQRPAKLCTCVRTAPLAGGAAPEAVPWLATQQILKATARQAGGRFFRPRGQRRA
jgi:hypothetical protein